MRVLIEILSHPFVEHNCKEGLNSRVEKKWTFFHEMTSDHSIIYSPYCIISIFLPSRHWLAWPHFISFQGYIQIHFIFFSTRCLYTSLLHVASPSCVPCIADDFTRKGNLSPTENRSSFFGVRRLLRLSFFYLVPFQPQTVADASKMLGRWEGEKRENEQCKDKMKGRAVDQSVEKTEREWSSVLPQPWMNHTQLTEDFRVTVDWVNRISHFNSSRLR